MPGDTDACLYLPSRYLAIRLANAWKRRRCGRRFGHFPAYDSLGIYKSCARCSTPLL